MRRIFLIRSWLLILGVALFSCGDETPEVISCDELAITLSELQYSDCGGSNGTLTVFAEGGKEPYSYWLNEGEKQLNNLFSSLEPQYYNIFVEDANGCIDSVRTFIGDVQAVRAIALTRPSGCGTADGSIEVIAKNGILPYRYQIGENEEYTNDNTFTGLPSGEYSVWVKDDRDCLLGIYPVILSGVTIESVSPILEAHCATSGCHESTTAPNLTIADEIEDNYKQIKEAIQAGMAHHNVDMPVEDIETVLCWAEDLNLKDN